MTRQKSENRIVPQGQRKLVSTRARARRGGGKAVPVKEQTGQLNLFHGTAEVRAVKTDRVDDGTDEGLPPSTPCARPKPRNKEEKVASATMENVVKGLRGAFGKVAANRGAAGPDGQSVQEVRVHLDKLLPQLERELLDGTYQPGEIRRVWIPKGSGGQRGLGIPNVVDRVVQEAVRAVIEGQYEPTFHEGSHGFRPGRSCHTAIERARAFVAEGYDWVVDFDLEKFFDKVNHQRLLARLNARVSDRRLLKLIAKMLRARVIMPDGVVLAVVEGVPQGGPLSPLLSNIVLDELDQELERRGHRFVRYADDCNVYVKSERAGLRVMGSLVQFIERRLRLKVNASKSAVGRPNERHFVGFRLKSMPDGRVEVLMSLRSRERIEERIRDLTPRNWGRSLRDCISKINVYLTGWLGFFGICTETVRCTLHELDAHVRRRLRAIQLAHWKRKRTRALRLIQLGANPKTAWGNVYSGRRSLWVLSHTPAVNRGLHNAYFAERGLVSLEQRWKAMRQNIVAPVQLALALG